MRDDDRVGGRPGQPTNVVDADAEIASLLRRARDGVVHLGSVVSQDDLTDLGGRVPGAQAETDSDRFIGTEPGQCRRYGSSLLHGERMGAAAVGIEWAGDGSGWTWIVFAGERLTHLHWSRARWRIRRIVVAARGGERGEQQKGTKCSRTQH